MTRARGFTLIEVVMVTAIIGLTTATVIWSLSPNGGADEAARRFAARAALAAQDSVIAGRPTGIDVDAEGYRFLRLRKGQWAEIRGDRHFEPSVWGPELDVSVAMTAATRIPARKTDSSPRPPLIVFDPTGLATPFRLAVTVRDHRLDVSGDERGHIEVQKNADARF
ncbi:MAG: type II secretion system minor pseudopilin GspH [Rhodospirillaceae bacterium]|nr:type II secretion system minor pseudopilin GspH [Rhodospirillaceae bacterium]